MFKKSAPTSAVVNMQGIEPMVAFKAMQDYISPVFRDMFKNSSQSSEIVNMQGIVPMMAFKAMLDYIYTGKTELSSLCEKTAFDLLYAAGKYELVELKEICVSYLMGKISIENIGRILEVVIGNNEGLKLRAFTYIRENFTALKKSEEWVSMQKKKPGLVIEVLTWIVEDSKRDIGRLQEISGFEKYL